MATRKVFVLTTPDGWMISDINKKTMNANEAITWVSEDAAIAGYKRAQHKLPKDLRLEQIALPFPSQMPARYLSP